MSHSFASILNWILGVSFLFCFSSSLQAQDLFDDSKLHEIRIVFEEENWFDTLAQYYESSNHTNDKKTLNAMFELDGVALASPITIRFKGQYSYSGFPGRKKPFRINAGKIDKSQSLNGTKKFNLHNLAGDPSFLREYIAYDFMRYQGIPASRTAFAKLYVNEVYQGCYLIVEEPEDDAFLQLHFGTKSGNLFEADTTTDLSWKGSAVTDYPEIKMQTKGNDESWNQLIRWMDLFNNYYAFDFSNQMNAIFETEAFFKVLASDIFIDNWDNYAANGRNFFMYEHHQTKKINWVPWDYNLSFWEKNLSLFPRDKNGNLKPLIWRVYNTPYFQRAYLEAACRLINYPAAQYPLEEKIKFQKALIAKAVFEDTNKFYTNEDFENNSHQAVTVTMLRGGINKEVYLPGLVPHWAKRRNAIRKEAASMQCNCDDITPEKIQKELSVQVFPNPSSNQLKVYSDIQLESVSYQIFNTMGQIVMNGSLLMNNGLGIVDLTQLQSGIYILNLNKDTFSKTIQIIKQ